MSAAPAARRSDAAPPPAPDVGPAPALRSRLRRGLLALADGAAAAFPALLRPTDALLALRLDLAPWRPPGLDCELLESRAWVEALADRARWQELAGVDRFGGYETAFLAKFRELASGAKTVLDVGAARGLYASLASPAVVHAFEPDPLRRLALRRNLAVTGGPHVIRRDWVGDGRAGTLALDDYCRRRRLRPDLVKLDIEGAEIDAVAGLSATCFSARPYLLIEFHIRRLRDRLGRDPEELLRLLHRYGYRARFNGHHGALETGDRSPDLTWADEPPNDRLVAVWAEPGSG